MKNIIILITCLLTGNVLVAQNARFVTSGTIEFEKTINMFGITRHEIGSNPSQYQITAFDEYKKKNPQFVKLKSTLDFANNKSLFTPILPDKPIVNFQENPMAKQLNVVYTDFNTKTSIAQKEVYGEKYLVTDATRKIKWRLTAETRDIAGYTCRRANGLILDSVYVVAFYTDKIWVSSGPESFSGLPGMILGVALTHENVTWYATKVTEQTIPPNVIAPPKKGKALNSKQLYELLKEGMKHWGAAGPYEMKVFQL